MSVPVPISAIVIASSEADSIEACLDTLAWCDECLVVDAFSRDGTSEAMPDATRLIERRFVDFPTQRQAALQRAAYDWVIFVDADERATDVLANEIGIRVGHEAHVAYSVPRRNRIFGHWMRGGGWAPDRQFRVMDRRFMRFRTDRSVHELIDVRGSVGELKHSLAHYGYRTVREFRCRQRRYASMAVDDLYAAGIRRRRTALVAQPLREIRRRLVEYRGYRDRWVGFQLALLMAEHEWLVQRGLAQRWRRTLNH